MRNVESDPVAAIERLAANLTERWLEEKQTQASLIAWLRDVSYLLYKSCHNGCTDLSVYECPRDHVGCADSLDFRKSILWSLAEAIERLVSGEDWIERRDAFGDIQTLTVTYARHADRNNSFDALIVGLAYIDFRWAVVEFLPISQDNTELITYEGR